MDKMDVLIVFIILFLIFVFLSMLFTYTYRKAVLNFDPSNPQTENCVTYFKECICTGELKIYETYPIRYTCSGLELCRDINETECQD